MRIDQWSTNGNTMHSRKLITLFFLVAGCICFAGLSAAKDNDVVYQSGVHESKVGNVDINYLFQNYVGTIEADRALKERASEKDVVRNQIKEQIEALKAQADDSDALYEKVSELKKYDDETLASIAEERKVVLGQIFQKINSSISEYGQREGYSIIYNAGSRKKGKSITKDILKLLNNS